MTAFSENYWSGPGKMLHSMRELNRKGVLTKLEDLDNRYLQKFFLGAKASKEIELSEVRRNLASSCNPASSTPPSLCMLRGSDVAGQAVLLFSTAARCVQCSCTACAVCHNNICVAPSGSPACR